MKSVFQELVTSQSEDKVQEMILKFKGEFFKMPLQEIATPRGVSDVSSFVGQTKSVPIHVKAALVHNDLIKKKGLSKEVREIKDGEKLKFAYLKSPNPMQSHVCAFQNRPHKALELEQWIDYDMQYEKMFLGPMNNVLNVIGWSSEKRNTLW
jgi:hypothetical protein